MTEPYATRRQIRTLAERVRAPATSILLIDENNARERFVGTLHCALQTGRAFAVRAAEDMLALDADDPDSNAVEQVISELAKFGYEAVVIGSGRPGHRHLLCPIRDPQLLERMKMRSGRLGLGVRHGGALIRPPLSPHRSGLPPHLLSHDSAELAIAALDRNRKPRALSPSVQLYLTNGTPKDTRSEMIQSIVNGYLRRRRTLEELESDLAVSRAGERVREEIERRGEDNAREWLRRSWTKGIEYVASEVRNAKRATRIEERAELIAAHRRWSGKNGSTDFAAYVAFYKKAEQLGKRSIDFSIRDWQLALGTSSRATIDATIERLIEAGLIRRINKVRPEGHAARYRLVLTDSGTHSESHPPTPVACVPFPDPGHDAFVWGGLGKSAYLTYCFLQYWGPTSQADLQGLLGRGPETVRSALIALAEIGMSKRLPNGTWKVLTRNLDDVAKGLRTTGTGKRRQRGVAIEREGYRLVVEERDKRREEGIWPTIDTTTRPTARKIRRKKKPET